MLRLPQFRLRRATTVAEAASVLANEPGLTRIVAGGTDLFPNLKRRHQRADTVLSLRAVKELYGVRGATGGELRIGAMTTLTAAARDERIRQTQPMLWRALMSISSPILRNTGTIGGNLCLDTRCTYYNQNEEWRQSIDYCMKAEGKTCWVAPSSPRCWAISASDSAPLLCAMGARVRLVSARGGERVIEAYDLFRDDGMQYLQKAPEEILTEVILPAPDGQRTSHWKLRRRGSIDYSVLTVGAAVWVDSAGIVTRANVHLGAVNSYPSRAEEVGAFLAGKPLNAETIAQAAPLARRGATPMDNTDFLARWRGHMVERYVEAALREVAGLDPGAMLPRHSMDIAG
ncbi:MAG: xanthine dehydrogenase family protein subunit M [Planctomycetota bacterium]